MLDDYNPNNLGFKYVFIFLGVPLLLILVLAGITQIFHITFDRAILGFLGLFFMGVGIGIMRQKKVFWQSSHDFPKQRLKGKPAVFFGLMLFTLGLEEFLNSIFLFQTTSLKIFNFLSQFFP